ncbi:MAG: tetratricopeptide repeat protein, partial [Opitutaceae bacterium]
RRAPGFLPGRPQLRDSQGAVEVLCRSIELDPANLAAHLQLGAVYEAQKKNSERNRLLDEMTARFPDDKQVLVQAARGCIGRNAFGKGLDYLARARQLDQLDPLIPELTTTALQRLARQQFQQRRPDKARQTLAQTEGSLSDKADDFQRSRWIALIRHGLMERLWGEAPQGESLLARARDRAPGLAAYWLFAHLTHRSYVKAYRCESPFLTELKQTLRRATRLGDIGLLLRILEYWKRRAETLSTYEEENLLVDCLAAAQKQPFTRTEAAGVFEHAHDNPEFSRPLRKLVKKILREDPLDPQFRLWMIDVDDRWRDPSGSRAELQSILDEAVRRHDETVIRKARQMLRDLDHPPPPPRPDAYAPEEEDEDDDFDPEIGPPLDLPPEMLAQFRELIEELRTAPDAVVRELRKSTMRDMPPFVFEALLQMARRDALPPKPHPKPPPPPRPPPAKSPPTDADPNQMNFF